MPNTTTRIAENWYPKTKEEINEFFSQNIKLIHSLLKPYKGCDEYDDMFQEASVGFFKGITTFCPSKGVKLTTYAYECAKNQVKMHLRRSNAKSRTATVVSLDIDNSSSDGVERESLLNKDLGERDSLHPSAGNLEDLVCQRDLFCRAMAIIDTEMSVEQQLVLRHHLSNIPQAATAIELNSSQANVSKILKIAICELVLMLRNRGIID